MFEYKLDLSERPDPGFKPELTAPDMSQTLKTQPSISMEQKQKSTYVLQPIE